MRGGGRYPHPLGEPRPRPPRRSGVGGRPQNGSMLSRWSIRSEDSLLSIASKGSVLSVGSVGSVLSIGSAGSALSAFSVGSVLSAGSLLSGLSLLAIMSWRGRGGRVDRCPPPALRFRPAR